MKILSVLGARPQFVKAALLSAEFARRNIEEVLVHTGQHYDAQMSDVFFEQLKIPQPKYNLAVGSGGHGAQTGEMLKRLEPIVEQEKPDRLLVFGDTNSTLAGALVAAKLHVPVGHVEAGLRSFNRDMPEEINRIVSDHIADLLLVPNEGAARQLAHEGIVKGVRVVGDLMVDLAMRVAEQIPPCPPVLQKLGVKPREYAVVTIHRASNTDDIHAFRRIVSGLRNSGLRIVFPVHPRTRALAQREGVGFADNIILCDPLPYLDMMGLLARSESLFTDSGGLQKEAFVLRVPCVTLREETEWLETLEDGWNVLAGTDPEKITAAAKRITPIRQGTPYGDGHAARNIVDAVQGLRSTAAVA